MDLSVALLVQSLMSLAAFAPLIVAPLILSTLGLESHWAGAYAPLAFGASIAASSLSGAMIGRLGPWRVSLYCMAALGAGAMIFALATGPAMVLGTLIVGFAYGPIAAAGSSILAQGGMRNLSLRMSVRQAGVPLGTSVGAFFLPTLSQIFGWSVVWAGMGMVLIVFAVALRGLVPAIRAEAHETRASAPPGAMQPFRFLRDQSVLRPVAFLFFIYAAVQTCFSSFVSIYLVDALHLDLRHAGILVGIGSGLGMVARVVWGMIADRYGTVRILVLIGITIAVAAVLTGLLSPATPLWMIAAMIAAFGSVATGWNGVMFARIAQLSPPGQVGAVAGELVMFAYIGFIVAAPAFSIVMAQSSIADAWIFAGVLCGMAAAAFAVIGRRKAATC